MPKKIIYPDGDIVYLKIREGKRERNGLLVSIYQDHMTYEIQWVIACQLITDMS